MTAAPPACSARAEIERGVDQRDVREGLREVADQPARRAVVFLGQQPDVVAQRQQPLEQRSRLRPAVCRMKASASQKLQARNAPSPGGSPSSAVLGVVAQHEPVDAAARARSPRPCRARAGRRAAGSRPSAAAAGSRRAACCRRTARSCRARGRSRARRPRRGSASRSARQRSTGPSSPKASALADRAVERDPGHHLGVGEVPRPAAHLPDALVRLAPDRLEVLERARAATPSLRRCAASPPRAA